MKSLISRASLLLTLLHLFGTINISPVQAQTISPQLNELDQENLTAAVPLIEQGWQKEFETYFKTNFSDESMTVKNIAATLGKIATQTKKKSAIIYLIPREQQLEIVLVTSDGKPIHKRVLEANQEVLRKQVEEFTDSLTSPLHRNNKRYLQSSQQLYRWMIAPIQKDLQAQNIDTLLFCVGEGLRTLPFAALHDGQQFLIEKYSFSRIPAFKLTDTNYGDLRNSQVLAMGASIFKDNEPLPAVPIELSTISNNQWQGKSFINQDFTLTNFQSQRNLQQFKIIHLATHADFQPGVPRNSYVQFWDEKLTLDRISQLNLNSSVVELLVLSACRTAIGDQDAELGFAGLAVQARVKSAIASLWDVSDQGTLALMTEFYHDLKTASIKAEALQQAQIALLKGKIRLQAGQLQTPRGNIALPPALSTLEPEDLSHPYYWAAFTVVGSPW